MYNEGGTVKVAGSTGYAAQDPWIQNATLRNNILMGSLYDEDRYTSIVSVQWGTFMAIAVPLPLCSQLSGQLL